MEMIRQASDFLEGNMADSLFELCGVYPRSLHESQGCTAFLMNCGDDDRLVVSAGFGFEGESFTSCGKPWVLAYKNHANACALRRAFPFTAPSPVLRKERSIGMGDRLGIATPGHIRALLGYDAYPVLAQQSIRELNLTSRNYQDVLDCASYAVFQEDFRRGFGADGDHLKTPEEVRYALDSGYTMITLDCSEYIRNDIDGMTDTQVDALYVPDAAMEHRYVGKDFHVGDYTLTITMPEFQRMCLIYNDAIGFAASIYQRFIAGHEDKIDFEISIDETTTPTMPAQHFYVASELKRRGVRPVTVAPRFIGEFQKGIDYVGDLAAFEMDLAKHVAIANEFDYKISVHSGSDKFSVFEAVGRQTGGHFHLKTAGTSWLEAMLVVAEHDPALYREIHAFVLDGAFDEARKYYHVTTDLGNIPDLSTLSDAELPLLLEKNNDERQLIHITYGLILNARNADGADRFRTRLYRDWRRYAAIYAEKLEHHLGRHLAALYRGIAK